MNRRGPTPQARVRRQVVVTLRFGDFVTPARLVTFHGLVDRREHLAIGLGQPGRVPLVRPHSECLTGDVLGSERCDCGPQLREAVERIADVGGYLLYLRQEGRGIGLYDKLDAYALQDQGLDTYDANLALGHDPDERDYTVAAQMLRALGVTDDRAVEQQPGQAPTAAGQRHRRRRRGSHRGAPVGHERPLPVDQGAPRRAHLRDFVIEGSAT